MWFENTYNLINNRINTNELYNTDCIVYTYLLFGFNSTLFSFTNITLYNNNWRKKCNNNNQHPLFSQPKISKSGQELPKSTIIVVLHSSTILDRRLETDFRGESLGKEVRIGLFKLKNGKITRKPLNLLEITTFFSRRFFSAPEIDRSRTILSNKSISALCDEFSVW